MDIVKAKAPLHTEAAFVGGTVDALDIFDLAVLDLERHLAANATEGADTLSLSVEIRTVTDLSLIHYGGRHKRTRRAGLHAFAAGHTGRRTHRIGNIKGRIGIVTATGHADHIVHLHFATGADAEAAGNTGIQVHAHRDVAVIQKRDVPLFQLGET